MSGAALSGLPIFRSSNPARQVNVRLNKARVLLGGFLLLLGASNARAHDAILTWKADDECPPAATVQSRVTERIREAGRATDSLDEVRAVVEREGDHFALSLSLHRGPHEVRRRLVAPTCEELVEALVWLVAIGAARSEPVVDEGPPKEREAAATPSLVGAELSQPPAELAAQPVAEQKEPPLSEPAAPAQVRERVQAAAGPVPAAGRRGRRGPTWFRASLGAGIWSAHLPGPQPQMLLGAGVGLGLFYLELRFSHIFERSTRFGEDGRASIRGEALTLLGCTLFTAGRRGRLGPCLSLAGMHSVAAAYGTTDPARGAYTWLLAGAGVQAALTLWGPLALIVDLGLGIPLRARPSFSVAGQGEVARASWLAEQGSLAIGAHW